MVAAAGAQHSTIFFIIVIGRYLNKGYSLRDRFH
jgi:hypothetical protein